MSHDFGAVVFDKTSQKRSDKRSDKNERCEQVGDGGEVCGKAPSSEERGKREVSQKSERGKKEV